MRSRFANRTEAEKLLAQAALKLRLSNPVVYALPRGGVPVAAQVADALHAPLDVLFVRKIGLPREPELALGAVVDGENPVTVWNDDVVEMAGLPPARLDALQSAQLATLERRRALYSGSIAHVDPAGRTAIVVDDGLATGATARAALRALRSRRAARVVLAIPVAPTQAIVAFRHEADDIVCLIQSAWFSGVGAFYDDFGETTDADVIEILDKARAARPA